MRAVLLSVKPKWCELIASGRKTLEIRKTKPKIETPFKVYIYCAADVDKWLLIRSEYTGNIYTSLRKYRIAYESIGAKTLNRKVIGEFVCDKIDNHSLSELIVKEDRELVLLNSYLTRDEVLDYLGYERGTSIYDCKNFDFYGWHISNLKIYDEPKKLSEFMKPCIDKYGYCQGCKYGFCKYPEWVETHEDLEGCCFETECLNTVKKAPQSWCYVEELNWKGREEK